MLGLVLQGASASPRKTSVLPGGEGPCSEVGKGRVSLGCRMWSCCGARRSGRAWGSDRAVVVGVGLSSVGGIPVSPSVGGGPRRRLQTMRLGSVRSRWVVRSRAGGARAPSLAPLMLLAVVRWVLPSRVCRSWTRAGRGARAPSVRCGCPAAASVPTAGPGESAAPSVASSVESPAAWPPRSGSVGRRLSGLRLRRRVAAVPQLVFRACGCPGRSHSLVCRSLVRG